jgi:peptidoglycan-associated lipoprotein
LLNFLNANPNVVIELSAHTDSRGTSRDNLMLSTKRAKSAVNYLMAHGIEKNRMAYKGYGETKLVNNCADGVECSEEKHQANRRLEFKIIKFN